MNHDPYFGFAHFSLYLQPTYYSLLYARWLPEIEAHNTYPRYVLTLTDTETEASWERILEKLLETKADSQRPYGLLPLSVSSMTAAFSSLLS